MKKWIFPALILTLALGFVFWHFFPRPQSTGSSEAKGNAALPSSPAGSRPSFESLFPLNPKLEEKKNELTAKVFSDTETGRKLADVVVLFNQGSLPEIHPHEASRMAFELAALRKDPDQTFKNLNSNLKNLPPEYAAEKQFLLQFASRLDTDKNAIGDFLATEMKTPVTLPEDGSRPPSSFTPLTALDAMIDAGVEPAKVSQALKEALEAQTDPAERLLLIGRYERLDREEAARLMKTYSSPPEETESQP